MKILNSNKSYLNKLFILCLIVFSTEILMAQQTIPRGAYQSMFSSTFSNTIVYSKPKNVSEFLYFFYKKNFSSIDINSCNFYPSCSTYGLESIKKHGILIGMFDTFDRLTRCHPKATYGKYPHVVDSHLLIDHP